MNALEHDDQTASQFILATRLASEGRREEALDVFEAACREVEVRSQAARGQLLALLEIIRHKSSAHSHFPFESS